jgi:hypothetical protein
MNAVYTSIISKIPNQHLPEALIHIIVEYLITPNVMFNEGDVYYISGKVFDVPFLERVTIDRISNPKYRPPVVSFTRHLFILICDDYEWSYTDWYGWSYAEFDELLNVYRLQIAPASSLRENRPLFLYSRNTKDERKAFRKCISQIPHDTPYFEKYVQYYELNFNEIYVP